MSQINVPGLGDVKFVEVENSKYIPATKRPVLSPMQKAAVHSASLKSKRKAYVDVNSQSIRYGKKRLTKSQCSWRFGYLQALHDLRRFGDK